MNISSRPPGEALKKIIDKFGLQIADQPHLDCCVYHRSRTSAEVYGCKAQGLVHGHEEVSCTHDAALIAQRAVERFAKGNSNILHCVVLVNIQIAFGFQLQVKSAVTGKELQHVIEKTYTGRDLITPLALNGESKLNISLAGHTMKPGFSHRATCDVAGIFVSTCLSSVIRRSIS